jgi:ribosomal protein L12E/L44/L45/RPP1/RPP2
VRGVQVGRLVHCGARSVVARAGMAGAARRRAGPSPAEETAAKRHKGKTAAADEPSDDEASTVVEGDDNDEVDLEALTQACTQNTQLVLQGLKKDWSNPKELPRHEADELVSAVMRRVLLAWHKGGYAPVKRAELTQQINGRFPGTTKRGLADYIIAEAQATFPALLGFEMREIERTVLPRGKRAADAEPKIEKSYVLRSCLPSEMRARYAESDEDKAWNGLAAAVAALVHTAGGTLTEEGLFGFLAQLGVSCDEAHPIFGEPAAMVKRLVDRRVLRGEKSATDGHEEVLYRLAEAGMDALPADKMEGMIKAMVTRGDGEEDEDLVDPTP